MRIPNMCLVLKLDNGKVVSIAHEQTHRITDTPSSALVYRYAPIISKMCLDIVINIFLFPVVSLILN